MSENQKKILEMLAAGKISVDEAQRLLSLVDSGKDHKTAPENPAPNDKVTPKYMHVVVEPKPGAEHFHGKVNVRVPFGLIRAGMKMAILLPPEVAGKVNDAMKEKGMDFDLRHLKPEDMEELITALRDTEINVDSDYETVRVYTE